MDNFDFKSAVRRAMPWLGINLLARRITRPIPRILMYHRFREASALDERAMCIDTFRAQLEYLRKHFVPIKLSELVDAREQTGDFPAGCVAVTIDDGYQDFLELALPVLEQLEFPATVFIVASLVEQGDWIWADKFNYLADAVSDSAQSEALQDTSGLFLSMTRMGLNDREIKMQELQDAHDVQLPGSPPPPYRLMSWDELGEVARSGLVEIGSHSCTHPIMSQIDRQQAQQEIDQSKSLIESRLSLKVTSFCYPNGQIGDYSQEHFALLRGAGYRCAVASHFGYAVAGSNAYALPRINYTGSDLSLFAKYLDGVEYLQRRSIYQQQR